MRLATRVHEMWQTDFTYDMVVPRRELEDAFLETVQEDILTEDAIAYVVDRAMDLAREWFSSSESDLRKSQERLRAVTREMENLARLAAKTGDLDVYGNLIKEQRAERAILETEIARAESPLLDAAGLRDPLESKVRSLREWFGGSRELGRKALRDLLGDRRLAVHPDGQHSFRIEGFFEVVPEIRTPQAVRGSEAFASVVAGARSDRLHTAPRRLIVKMHFGA
jgi:hypothetical protein